MIMKLQNAFLFIAFSILFLCSSCTKENSIYSIDDSALAINKLETVEGINDQKINHRVKIVRPFPIKIVPHACMGDTGVMVLHVYDEQTGVSIKSDQGEYNIKMEYDGEPLEMMECFCGGTVNVKVVRLEDGAVGLASYESSNCQ